MKAEASPGKFARYFSVPFYRGCLFIWQKSHFIEDRHLRAGLRSGAILYFGWTMVLVAAFVGYVIVAIVVAIAVLLFVIWLAARILSGDQPSVTRRTTVSRSGTDFFGNQRTEVFDGGRKISEVRSTTDFLGNPKQEICDLNERKIGERIPSSDVFGSPTIDELDGEGKKVGTSELGTDLLGQPIEVQFNNSGQKVAESRHETGLLGEEIVTNSLEKEIDESA
jgi:hypothetical protein